MASNNFSSTNGSSSAHNNEFYTCEICGESGFSEETMRSHTRTTHIEGHGSCPFCDLAAGTLEELTLHVNQIHLDYLTPENELLTFIDEDNTPGSREEIDDHNWNDILNDAHDDANNDDDDDDDDNKGACGGGVAPNMNIGRGYGGGEGSPYRSQLALKLKSNVSQILNSSETGDATTTSVSAAPPPGATLTNGCSGSSGNAVIEASPASLQCPLCPHRGENPARLEEHINRQHFDLTSPIVTNDVHCKSTTTQQFSCPLCVRTFQDGSDLELHVYIEHRDVLSPAGCTSQTSSSQQITVAAAGVGVDISPSSSTSCPVCGALLETVDVARHVEEHFPAASPDQRESQRMREQHEFDLLRAQYGMDNQGNFREQSVANMQRAVYAGEMSVADYYERQLELRQAESYGVDDGSSVTKHIVQKVRVASPDCLTCTYVDHYASSYGDRGWGCGYRNAQMLLSSLLTHTGYNELLYKKLWSQTPPHGDMPSRTAVPSISRLQKLIEAAWAQGFDLQGSEQLGSRLHNTRKWIGATEVVTLLSSFRIKCQLVDFHRPTSSDGTHPELFAWVLNYFQDGCSSNGGGSGTTTRTGGEFLPPLYLQHQGHSRTIMGVEYGTSRDSSIQLLVLDPSHAPQQMAQLNTSSTVENGMRLLRKGLNAMKARQYQLVAAVGTIDSEVQYQQSKVLRGIRIPQDR